MDIQTTRRVYARMTYLAYCAVVGITPRVDVIGGVDIEAISAAARRHSIGALVYRALDSVGMATSELLREYSASVRRIILLDNERAEIQAWMEKQGIRYMPLKGVVLKDYYPEIGLRQMADNDILFDEKYRKTVRDYFKSRGYDVKCYNRGNHDVYMKNPVYNYEMHVTLFSHGYLRPMRERFINALDDAILVDGTKYQYRMNENEYYIYIKCHEFKHYTHGGMGVRFFMDNYVILKALGDRLDLDFIHGECEKIGIGDYEARTRALSLRIFDEDLLIKLCEYDGISDNDPLTASERELFDFSCFAGTYGTVAQHIATNITRIEEEKGLTTRGAKVRYFFSRMVLPMSAYQTAHPFIYKHKWLIPFHTVWRLISAVFTRPRTVWRQIKTIVKFKKR